MHPGAISCPLIDCARVVAFIPIASIRGSPINVDLGCPTRASDAMVNKAFAREHGYDFKLAVAAQRGRFSGLFTGVLLGHHGSLRSVFLFVMGRGLFPESFPLVALAWGHLLMILTDMLVPDRI